MNQQPAATSCFLARWRPLHRLVWYCRVAGAAETKHCSLPPYAPPPLLLQDHLEDADMSDECRMHVQNDEVRDLNCLYACRYACRHPCRYAWPLYCFSRCAEQCTAAPRCLFNRCLSHLSDHSCWLALFIWLADKHRLYNSPLVSLTISAAAGVLPRLPPQLPPAERLHARREPPLRRWALLPLLE